MELQFYVFIMNLILTWQPGKGIDEFHKQANEIKETNNSKYLLLVVVNSDERKKPISRTNYDILSKKAKIDKMRLRNAHEMRMKVIIDFMKTHIYSTDYLLKEVQRIKRDREIKDDLREMVSFLEKPSRSKEKDLVLNFFKEVKKKTAYKKIFDLKQRPNDGSINILKDPFNDGVPN